MAPAPSSPLRGGPVRSPYPDAPPTVDRQCGPTGDPDLKSEPEVSPGSAACPPLLPSPDESCSPLHICHLGASALPLTVGMLNPALSWILGGRAGHPSWCRRVSRGAGRTWDTHLGPLLPEGNGVQQELSSIPEGGQPGPCCSLPAAVPSLGGLCWRLHCRVHLGRRMS